MRVITGTQPALAFESPVDLLYAHTPAAAWEALARADAALDAGYYVAGFLSYELGADCVSLPIRASDTPLVALGVYERPRPLDLTDMQTSAAMGPLAPRIDYVTYAAALETIHEAIRNGDAYQINYTLPFDFAFAGDPLATFALLARRSGTAYAAYAELGDLALVSLSPELFLRFDGSRLTTKPMKGTAPLERAEELGDAKNRAEHVMIVDLLRNDLHRICDDVRVERIFEIERYPTFATMTSTITGTLRGPTPLADVMRATFPCGSVTGAPKRAAMSLIAQLEPTTRDVYTGSIGYLSPQRTGWWNVAIRTLQIDRSRGCGRLDAGGGIVADSHAPYEWDEVLLKTRFARTAIEPFAFWETLRVGPEHSDLSAHAGRLLATSRRFAVPANDRALRDALADANDRATQLQLARVRLSLDGEVTVSTEPLAPTAEPARICLADARVRSDDPMLAYKSAWRPAHARAAAQAERAGCFDAILRNERDELTEGSRTNLFVCIDGVLYTPPLRCGVLPGILRSRLVSGGQAAERVLTVADLQIAEAVFVGNSARGLLQAHFVSEPSHV